MEINELNNFKNKWCIDQIQESKTPENLSHYTTQGGFHGMTISKKFWLTRFTHLNDPSEFNHGIALFISKFDYLKANGIEDDFLSRFHTFIESESKNPDLDIYLMSFTQKDDLLSQWRGYGDNGNGFSISVAPAKCLKPNSQEIFWAKVEYNDQSKNKIIDNIYSDFLKLIQALNQNGVNVNDVNIVRQMFLALFQVIFIQSVRFKHSAWEEECEHRLVALVKKNDPSIKQRTNFNGSLINYIESGWLANSVETFNRVRIGARANYKNCTDVLETFKNQNSFVF